MVDQLAGGQKQARASALQALHEATLGPWGDPDEKKRHNLMWACLPFVVAAWDQRDPRKVFGRGEKSDENSSQAGPSESANGQAGPAPSRSARQPHEAVTRIRRPRRRP